MKKLFKYLEKNGCDFRKEKAGSSYFYNVPEMVKDLAVVIFEYTEIQADKREKDLLRYCKRYGYKITSSGGWIGCRWYHIMSGSDFEELDYLGRFVRMSVDECEQEIHAGRTDRLKEIMDYFGALYLDAVKAINAA